VKTLNLCIALIFSLSLCFTAVSVDSYAKSSDTTSTVEKTSKTKVKSSTKSAASKKVTAVNVNSAGKDELTKIPGVGPATADAIVKYRKANGKFKSANDLMNVKGIGEKTLKKMKPFLKL